MAVYEVRTPFSGAVGWARACYNNKCPGGAGLCMNHPANTCTACGSAEPCPTCHHCIVFVGGSNPIDISGPASAAVKLITSWNVQCVRVTRKGLNDDGDGICTDLPPAGFEWVNEGVLVELFRTKSGNTPIGPVGNVYYGHLRSRIANGIYTSTTGFWLALGYLGQTDCACPCYRGIHVHMEQGWVNGVTLSQYGFNYNASLSTTQWLYRYTTNN